MRTPTLEAAGGLVLHPVALGDLTEFLAMYNEAPVDGRTALPWLYPHQVAEQIGDMVRDIIQAENEDRIHFWCIRDQERTVGTIALGDELQLDVSSWSLGS